MCKCDKLKYWKASAYMLAIVVLLMLFAHQAKHGKAGTGEGFRELFRKAEDEEKSSWFPDIMNTI